MGQTAEFSALTRIDSGLIGFETQRVHAPWNRITLTVERRDPVRVDDIAAGFAQQDLGSNWNNQLTRRNDRRRYSVLRRIVVLPPPLLTSDVNDHFCVIGLGKIKHCARSKYTDTSKNQRWDNGHRDFKNWLAMGLVWNRLPTILEPENDNGNCN